MSRMGWLLALFLAFGASPGRGGEPSDRVNFLFIVQEGAYHWIVLDHSSLRGLVDPSRDLEDLTRLTEDMLWISLCGELTAEARQRVRARLEEMGPLEIRATSGVLGVEDWKPGVDSDNHALGPAALLRHIVPGEDGLRNLLRSLPRHGDSDTSVDSETGGTVRKAFLEAPPLLVVPIYGFTDVPGPLWARWQKGKAEGIGLQVFKDSERWGQEDALARGSQPPGWEKARGRVEKAYRAAAREPPADTLVNLHEVPVEEGPSPFMFLYMEYGNILLGEGPAQTARALLWDAAGKLLFVRDGAPSDAPPRTPFAVGDADGDGALELLATTDLMGIDTWLFRIRKGRLELLKALRIHYPGRPDR